MSHLLTDCEDLLKKAWKEVRFTVPSYNDRERKLREYLKDLEHTTSKDLEKFGTFQSLVSILKHKSMPSGLLPWRSCKELYETMLMLLNSNYKKYSIISIGEAEKYFKEAIPLYCQLSGEQPPKLKVAKEQKKISANLQEQLKNGDILIRLKNDIPEITILQTITAYKNFLAVGAKPVLNIAYRKSYNVQVVLRSIDTQGINIDNTNYKIHVINIKTGNELKTETYSDIKRILSR